MAQYKIDNKIYTLEELKEGYKIITGLDNIEDFTEEQLFNYLKDALHEEGAEDLEKMEG